MNLTWFGWVYLALVALSGCLNINKIGKRRDPITHGEVVVGLIGSLLIVWGLFSVGVTK